MAHVYCFPSGPFETNAYLLACPKTNEGIFIDPAVGSAEELIQAAEGIEVEDIVVTHSHWDHIGAAKILKDYYFGMEVYVHIKDQRNLIFPGSDGLPLLEEIEGVDPDVYLEEGQVISVGDLELKVIETPGNTPGGVCFYVEKEKIIFTGDILFEGAVGNHSLPTAHSSDIWSSLEKLEKLPPETMVYPGHGPSTLLGNERWLPHPREIFN